MTLTHRTLFFAAYALCLVAVNARVAAALVNLSLHDSTASHHVIVPFISLALIYRSRDLIFRDTESDRWSGSLIVLAGSILALAAPGLSAAPLSRDALSLKVAALVVQIGGGFLLVYGRRAAAAAIFPLIFLAAVVPFPSTVLSAATLFLKSGSAEAVSGLFTLTGMPFHREGFVFALPQFVIEIADNCSGIRSSIALLLTAALAAHLFLSTRWRQALLLIAILPIAIVKNAIRIVGLSLLAVHVDRGFLHGQLHNEGGIVFFLLALAILTPLLTILRNSEPATSSTSH